MSTTKKLSEVLRNWSDSDFEDSLADDARALKERVAELEGRLRADLAMMDEKDVATAAANARAEAAEHMSEALTRTGVKLEIEAATLQAKLSAAEAEVARLKTQMADQLAAFEQAWVEPKALAAEVARLREDSTWKRVEEAEGLYISIRDERDALQAKLDGTDGKWKLAAAQATALRAKLEKVRAKASASQGNAIAYIDNFVPASDILRILDGEGDT